MALFLILYFVLGGLYLQHYKTEALVRAQYANYRGNNKELLIVLTLLYLLVIWPSLFIKGTYNIIKTLIRRNKK